MSIADLLTSTLGWQNAPKTTRITRALACPEIGIKWFLFFFCLFASNMGLFDRRTLTALTDDKSREPRQIPQGAGFPHTQTPQKRNKYHF